MELINYAGSQNMILTEDAQIVQGVSGNGFYLPAGTGSINIFENRNEISLSIWRQWDGVVAADYNRGVFELKNIKVFFNSKTDNLNLSLHGLPLIETDIKDNQELIHWCFIFLKNESFKIYKNGAEVYNTTIGNYPADFSEGLKIGGGRTHATFDEVRLYKRALKIEEVKGLYVLISKGTQLKHLNEIIANSTPKYLGVTEAVPTTRTVVITKGERLGAQDANSGDWVLMSNTVGGWKCGVCYRWSGSLWLNLEPEYNYVKEYHACLLHLMDIEELKEKTGHFGALFAKVLIAQKAMIDELVVKKLHIDSDKNSNQDFEAWFDEMNGLLVKNQNKKILEVNPDGNAVFTGRVNVGEIQLIDSGIFIREGEISIENAGWKGSLRPCKNGVEFVIMGGNGGIMKKQLYTRIAGGVMSLFVLGTITCNGGLYKGNTAVIKNGWNHKRSGVNTNLRCIANDGNTWVAAGDNGTIIVSTDNGNTWTSKSSGTTKDLRGIAINGNTWVAVGANNTIIVSADNGNTWTSKKPPSIVPHNAIANNGNTWIAVGQFASIEVSTDNGNTWTPKSGGIGVMNDIAHNGNTWIIAGDRGTIIVSTDNGNTWTSKSSGTTMGLNCIANDGNMWIAAGSGGIITISTDNGNTWTSRDRGIDLITRSIAINGNTAVAIGDSFSIYVSADNGNTWAVGQETNDRMNAVAHNGNTWIIVGDYGVILVSKDTLL